MIYIDYIAVKTYKYDSWVADSEKPAEGETKVSLCPTASIRKTRWK